MDIQKYEEKIKTLKKHKERIKEKIQNRVNEIDDLETEICMLQDNINLKIDRDVVDNMIGHTYRIQKRDDKEVDYITVESVEQDTFSSGGVYWKLFGTGYYVNRYNITKGITKFEHSRPRKVMDEYIYFDYARDKDYFKEISIEEMKSEVREAFEKIVE